MEDLLELLPGWLIVAVVGPFLLGVVLLALLVEPTGAGLAFVFVLFASGAVVLGLLGLGLTLSIRQSRGLSRQREGD